MPDDRLVFDQNIEVTDLIASLRQEEDLLFRLVSCQFDPAKSQNVFAFDSHLHEPEPDPADFLNINLYDAGNARKRAAAKKTFIDYGGTIVADGMLRIREQDVYAIFYRGPEPELPASHNSSPAIPAPSEIPSHAKATFEEGGELSGIPWDQATTLKMPLTGMKDGKIMAFKNQEGGIDAFIMITDADIDTDGPGGSKAFDRCYSPYTSLTFSNGASCDSRKFPGVVCSAKLRLNPVGLRMGDFAFVCFNGKVVPCQIYDQGPDNLIGEISLFAAREVGGVPQNESEHIAAEKGNFTKELVTLCFPASSANRHALSNAQIAAGAQHALEAFLSRSPAPRLKPATTETFAIYSRATWGALKPKVSSFNPAAAAGIVIHNTQDQNRSALSGKAERDAAFDLSVRIQHSHMFERGWSDTGQHFTISRGGIIMEGRAGTLDAALKGQVVRGAHAGVTVINNQWWGIELEGDFRKDASQLTPQQAVSVRQLCQWLASFIPGFVSNTGVKVHRQVKPGGTDCAGKLLDPQSSPDFLTKLRTQLTSLTPSDTSPTII